jgi:hypothetical protein
MIIQSLKGLMPKLTIYLSSVLGIMYGQMNDRLIYQQVKRHHFYTILKWAYAKIAFHSLGLSVLAFTTIKPRLDNRNYLILITNQQMDK